jgi:hypothetical protein
MLPRDKRSDGEGVALSWEEGAGNTARGSGLTTRCPGFDQCGRVAETIGARNVTLTADALVCAEQDYFPTARR